jgi:SUMO ligase MMS21 Smc5/6 complex component
MMARGEHFNHKNKNHPGNFPENSVMKRQTTEAQEDEELLVTQEAFKNRVEEEE